MKMRIVASSLIMFSLFVFTGVAEAARQKPIMEFENQTWVRADGKTLPMEQVKTAMLMGIQDKGWNIEEWTDGSVTAKIVVRGKHTVIVSITYSTDQFNLYYKDSDNMLYKEKEDGTKVIHKNYNRWAEQLVSAIRNRLITFELE
jgi:hypothetical protein